MPTSAFKDLLKKWEAVRAMVLEWHPYQADISRLFQYPGASTWERRSLRTLRGPAVTSRSSQVQLDSFNYVALTFDGKLRSFDVTHHNLVALHFKYDQARRRFVEWAQNEIAVVPDFHKRILFSDEAHFWLNGYVNKQNCRIWSEANPQVYVETPIHPEKLTVWCALWAGGILLQKR
ncbi:hypothetical protein TNCV_4367411 [Trichonephila clavipes]|nr:hypothetical protein TNCV_4367411 [Trichonephila clavipes]